MASVPNYFSPLTPLGQSLASLANNIMNGPSEADQITSDNNALLTTRKVRGQQSLADFFRSYDQAQQPPEVQTTVAPSMPATPPPAPPPGIVQAPPVAPAPAVSPGTVFSAFAGRVSAPESGGNPNAKNPRSSAGGADQFIDSTWLAEMKAHHPDITAGKTDQQILALRGDPNLSQTVTADYAADNGKILQAHGLPVNDTTLYLAHGFGASGASAILKADPNAPASSVLPTQVIRANPQLANMTCGQVVASYGQKIGDNGVAATTPSIVTAPNAPQITPAVPIQQPNPVKDFKFGDAAANALYADVDPTKLGEYELNIAANRFGARSPATTNAAAGLNQYGATAEASDLNRADKAATENAVLQNAQGVAAIRAAGQTADPRSVTNAVDYMIATGNTIGRGVSQKVRDAAMAELGDRLKAAGLTMDDFVNKGIAVHARNIAAGFVAKQGALTNINEKAVEGAGSIIQNLVDQGAAGPTNIKSLNDVVQWARRETNDPNAQNLANAISTYSNEYARVMQGLTTGAGSTDAARDQAAARLTTAMSAGNIEQVMAQMHQEMVLRSAAYEVGLGNMTGGQLHGDGSPAAPAAKPAAALAPVKPAPNAKPDPLGIRH